MGNDILIIRVLLGQVDGIWWKVRGNLAMLLTDAVFEDMYWRL